MNLRPAWTAQRAALGLAPQWPSSHSLVFFPETGSLAGLDLPSKAKLSRGLRDLPNLPSQHWDSKGMPTRQAFVLGFRDPI